jgi:hypothetical protein
MAVRPPPTPVDSTAQLIRINTMESDTTAGTDLTASDTAAALWDVIGARLADIDLGRAMTQYPTPEALAARMLDTLPDVAVTNPPIGACYSASALARWKQLSRQGIDQQRRAGRLFAVMIDHRWLYPSVQFDQRGRQSAAFAALLERQRALVGNPFEFAVWLETPEEPGGPTPRARLQSASGTRTVADRTFDDFVPTIVDPPYGASTLRDAEK